MQTNGLGFVIFNTRFIVPATTGIYRDYKPNSINFRDAK